MSITDPRTDTTGLRNTTNGLREHRSHRETRLFAKTSEFWALLVGVGALAVIYNAAQDTSLDLWRACLLATLLGIAYIVSRGFAKAGSRHDDDDHELYRS